MKITIKAYSLFRDYLGEELVVDFDREVTVEELILYLKEKFKLPEDLKPIVIVNGVTVSDDYVVKENAVVHLTPQFSGGFSCEDQC